MAIASMTGYARAEGREGGRHWVWEVRSVNGRGLDVRCRVPTGYERFDQAARGRVSDRLARGNVTLNLTLRTEAAEARPVVNRDLLDRILELRGELGDRVADTPPRLESLLSVRGLIDLVESEEHEAAAEARDAAILASLDRALADLAEARAAEGARLGVTMSEQVDRIAALAGEARELESVRPEAIRARLAGQVEELLGAAPALPEDRLLQEAALLAAKADVREEIDRIGAHVEAARALLNEGGAVGRRLEFLTQEFNREANTLCAKASDIELTRIGLALKATIDQLREQVQNVE